MNLQDRFRGSLVGLACGDAVGATLEFRPRGTFTPLTDMVGGGVVGKAGEWTDDTILALCLANSLIEKGFDPADQMKKYSDCVYKGYIHPTIQKWIGIATSDAIFRHYTTGEALSGSTDPRKSGNGSLMRLCPVPMYCYPDLATTVINSAISSKTTHSSLTCIEACMLFGEMLHKAFSGESKESILFNTVTPVSHPEMVSLKQGTYKDKTDRQIRGTGYVVASLEASLWCFLKTSNFRDAILMAANLGDDADTTAAITGQIAGAFYGYEGIPQSWKDKLDREAEISNLAIVLCGDKQ